LIRVPTPADFAAHLGENIVGAETVTISGREIDAFTKVSGDRQWIHGPAAERRIVPGNLLIALLPRMIQSCLVAETFARCLTVKYAAIRFRHPVREGAAIGISIRVMEVRNRAAGTFVTLDVRLTDQASGNECLSATVTDYYETEAAPDAG